MPRPPSEALTDREAQIMAVLWDAGPATADQIRQNLSDPLHDSTVRTMLRVLESKGYVKHSEEGKAYVYRAAMPRAKAEGTAVRRLLDRFFGGDAHALVQRLIDDEQLTSEQVRQLQRIARDSATRRGGAS